jgi:2,3-diketo-5-methylthio-1-phosphopentane phosphatase
MNDYKLKVFCDFDGTITKHDVWENSLARFIRNRERYGEILDDFYSLRIGAQECNRRLLEIIEDFNFDEFHKYLDAEELDDYFKEFVEYCKVKDMDLFVVSGGFEYYINYIFKREGIDVKYFCSSLKFDPIEGTGNHKLSCEFPYADENCPLCETSKRNILINNTNDLYDEVSVYIGDSVSDYCVVNYADIVFAKGRLASFCWKNNITYFEYFSFKDVMNKLDKLINSKKIKHRQTAKTNRKDVLLGG